MTNKQIRQLIASPTQVLVADGVDLESNLGYYGLSSIGKALLGAITTSQGQEALSLVPGTHVQVYDSDLDAIASLSTTGAIERTGAGTAATFTVTNSAKQLLDDSSFASMRTTLELGSISTQSASNVAITGGSISNITDLAIADGGTGSSTAQGAINALAGAVTSGQYLRGNGTNVVMSAIQASDVPTLNQNTTGTASNVTGIVAVANGGTGANTVPQARTNLGLVIGTDVQAYDADLAAIAALTTTGLVDRTGSGTATTRATGATGLAVLASADAPTARAAIGASPVDSPTFTGTATAGKFSPTANTVAGNGMYLPATNNLAFSTAGAERMRINNAGGVVIGTSTQDGRLVVGGSIYQEKLGETSYDGSFQGVSPYLTLINKEEVNNAFSSISLLVGYNGTAAVTLNAIRTGQAESAFAVSTRNGAFSSEKFRITGSGNVGIGTSAPATRLHVDGTIRYTNRPAAATITAIGFDANGDLRASSSSLRYKYDIQNLETGLEEVMQLRPVQFKFNGETRTNMGFIAEEVDKLGLADVMLYNEENQPEGVIYANMVSLLTKAIQEQQAQIEELKSEINLLKGV